jgi:hypothetical protein
MIPAGRDNLVRMNSHQILYIIILCLFIIFWIRQLVWFLCIPNPESNEKYHPHSNPRWETFALSAMPKKINQLSTWASAYVFIGCEKPAGTKENSLHTGLCLPKPRLQLFRYLGRMHLCPGWVQSGWKTIFFRIMMVLNHFTMMMRESLIVQVNIPIEVSSQGFLLRE